MGELKNELARHGIFATDEFITALSNHPAVRFGSFVRDGLRSLARDQKRAEFAAGMDSTERMAAVDTARRLRPRFTRRLLLASAAPLALAACAGTPTARPEPEPPEPPKPVGAVATIADGLKSIADGVRGILPALGVDSATAQRLLGLAGQVAGIASQVASGASADGVRGLVAEALPLVQAILGLLPAGGGTAGTVASAIASLLPTILSLAGLMGLASRPAARATMTPDQATAILRRAASGGL